jgi:uncharacterized protein YrzB (UPF0473 family)
MIPISGGQPPSTEDGFMSGEFGNDFISLRDDDGNEVELEHHDTVEVGGEIYMAFFPTDIEEDDEDYGLIILKVTIEGDDEYLSTVDDDDEQEAIYEIFKKRFSEDENLYS